MVPDIGLNFAERFTARREDEHIVECDDMTGNIPPLACRFTTGGYAAVADEDGAVMVLNTARSGQHSLVHDWRAHENAVFDVAWVPQARQLVTASGDKSCALWDCTTQHKISMFKGHSSSVKTVNFQHDNSAIFASGSRDGHIMLWDIRVKQKGDSMPSVNVIRNPHAVKEVISSRRKRRTDNTRDLQFGVTSVIFQDEHTLISAGSSDGDVKVWDLRKTYTSMKKLPVARDVFPYSRKSTRSFGISSIILDSTRTRLFASCMDSVIYQFDCAAFNKEPVFTYRGHQMASFYIRLSLSPDDSLLLSGSSDSHAYIWPVEEPSSPVVLQGHNKEVSDVSWCPDDACRILTTSDDCTLRVWRTDPTWGSDAPNEPNVVIGQAVRMHKDVGVSTCSTPVLHKGTPALRKLPTSHRKRTGSMSSPRILPSRACSPRKFYIPISSQNKPILAGNKFEGTFENSSPVILNNNRPNNDTFATNHRVSPIKQLNTESPSTSIAADGSPLRRSPRKRCKQTPEKADSPDIINSPPSSPMQQIRRRLNTTPRKQAMVPVSPTKLSTQMMSALESMTKNRPAESTSDKTRGKPMTLQSWLAKSKQKTTPRKISITPKKIQSSSGIPESAWSKEPNTIQRRVKRKLTDCYGEVSSSKRQKFCDENTSPAQSDVHTASDKRESENNRVPNDCLLTDTIECIDKKKAGNLSNERKCLDAIDNTATVCPAVTPHKEALLSSPSHYRSPTVNLPNFVQNPSPRTPRARAQSNSARKTRNWFTQMKDNKTPKSEAGIENKSSTDAKSEPNAGASDRKENSKTSKTTRDVPKASKAARGLKTPLRAQTSGSILRYLSPQQKEQYTKKS